MPILDENSAPIVEAKMRAFTHFCSAVSFSLFNEVLTIYPKNRALAQYISRLMDKQAHEIKVLGYLMRAHLRHPLYHQDDFDPDNPHFHLCFNGLLGEAKFAKVLTFFVKYKLITVREKEVALEAYRQANILPLAAISRAEVVFLSQLACIHMKAEALKVRKAYSAAEAARQVYSQLGAAYDNYAKVRTREALEQFQQIAEQVIDKSRDELEKHRGWSELLANVGMAIVLLGVGYLLAGLYNLYKNNRFILFSPKTDAAEKLDGLAGALTKLNVPTPAS